jgi:NAD+-processing family protein with receiver domain
MKLWLDDIREPPDDGWVWAVSVDEAELAMQSGEVTEAAFDARLGEGQPRTGELIRWMGERELWPRELISLHGARPGELEQLGSLICELGGFAREPGAAAGEPMFRRCQPARAVTTS